MRHQGHEVHLVTQDPRYLDVHLRRLCNSHIHYWRVFKSAQLLRFESEVVVEKVELKTSFKDADKKSLRLDKRYFGAYTSSNAKHHFQTKVPTKFILALCVILGAGILVYRAYERYAAEKAQAATATSAPAGSMVDQVRIRSDRSSSRRAKRNPMRRKAPPATSDGACLGYPSAIVGADLRRADAARVVSPALLYVQHRPCDLCPRVRANGACGSQRNAYGLPVLHAAEHAGRNRFRLLHARG